MSEMLRPDPDLSPAWFSRWTQECVECNRVFDLDIDIDANELQYGHDCEG